MESNKTNEIINSRKSSFSELSKSSSFINVEDVTATLGEGIRWLSTSNNTDFEASNSPIPSSFGSASEISEVETVVDSDCDDKTNATNSSTFLREQFFDALQETFKKQDFNNPLFDIVFLVGNQEIYAHMLILHLSGAKKLIKYIEKNCSEGNIRKVVDMSIIDGKQLTFDDLYIFTKSLYFNNVENDLTATNVMLLLSLAKLFGIKTLKNDCQIYLNSQKWEEDALILLEKANTFFNAEIVSKCFSIISRNTEKYLYSTKFLEIKHATLVQLLNQRIFKTDAKTLFDKVCDWATKNACLEKDGSIGTIYRETLGEALTLIPFEEMSQNQIFEIYQKGILTSAEGMSYLKDILTKKESAPNSTLKTEHSKDDQTVDSPIEEILKMPITKYLFKAME